MSSEVNWYDDRQRVIYWRFRGKGNWDEDAAAQRVSNALIQRVDHTVNVIGNLEGSPILPPNAISVYRANLSTSEPNTGVIVLVGANAFVRTMINLFLQLFPKSVPGTDFMFAKTDEEARALLAVEQEPVVS